ncbi:MAG: hypothetical protein KI791_16860 [Cyclobacteriaceae bacterium]|nr:hypothetical protein [Cyclobacteriaceae bacterium SS2]
MAVLFRHSCRERRRKTYPDVRFHSNHLADNCIFRKMIIAVNYFRKCTGLFGILLLLCSCAKENTTISLDIETESKFTGTFETYNSEIISGEVTLQINQGTYTSTTGLPFGKGAGHLKIDGHTVTFVDTLFFPVPTIYGPSYVLSGEHQYKFDGQNLTIWKSKNVGQVRYQLKLDN